MTRVPDWPERMARYLTRYRKTPFAWGEHDCVLFAAGWIKEATGDDPLGELRGRWTDAMSAARLVRDLGGLAAAVTAVIGAPLASTTFAQRGDIALIEQEDARGLGIVVGTQVAVVTERGIGYVELSEAAAAWRI